MAYYYDITEDFKRFPNATLFVVFGGRSTGKTYSTLKCMYENNKRFVFIKRTIDDVNLLCNGQTYGADAKKEKQQFRIDASPFKPINRDIGSNVKAFKYYNGVGGFYKCTPEGEPVGEPIGYLFALSAVTKFKGFDLSECEFIIFDEFVPKPYDRINKKEGEQLLDLFKTIERDRLHRNAPKLKLICLANADNAVSPVTQTFGITDDIVKLSMSNQEYLYNNETGLLLHNIKMNKEFMKTEGSSDIYKLMKGSQWEEMALENKFGYNDFSQVKKINTHRMRCLMRVLYDNKYHYVYLGENGQYYITFSKSDHFIFDYDLRKDKDQFDFVTKSKYDIMRKPNVYFETYSLYYLYFKCDKIF